MKFGAGILGLFVVGLCTAPIPTTARAATTGEQAPLNCASGKEIYDAWTPAREAYSAGDMAGAKPFLDAIVAACPTAKLAEGPRVMRAEIAAAQKDYAGALRVLGDMDRPMANALGPLPSFIALRATAELKDAAGYSRERQRLVDGIEQRLTNPSAPKAKLLERFSLDGNRVSAFEGEYQNGPFVRHITFLIQASEPFSPLRTVMLTTSPASALLGGPPVFILDEYTCGLHATLEIISGPKPTYDVVRKKLEHRLAEGSTSPAEGADGELCGFSSYVAPGFDRGA